MKAILAECDVRLGHGPMLAACGIAATLNAVLRTASGNSFLSDTHGFAMG